MEQGLRNKSAQTSYFSNFDGVIRRHQFNYVKMPNQTAHKSSDSLQNNTELN